MRVKAIIGVLALLNGSALAQTAQPVPSGRGNEAIAVDALVGVWELSSSKGQVCRLQLRADPVGEGRGVGTTPACRRAIPLLSALARWSTKPEGGLVLASADGRAILAFGKPDADGARRISAGGQDYGLKPVHLRAPPDPGATATARPAAAPPLGALPVVARAEPASGAPLPDAMPGLYLALRLSGSSGCRVQLLAPPDGADRRPARLEPGCADAGLIVFNPVAWRYADGRLTLIAAKGHDVSLVFRADGSFWKDPPSGAALALKPQ